MQASIFKADRNINKKQQMTQALTKTAIGVTEASVQAMVNAGTETKK